MTRRVVLLAGGGTGGHLMPALALADALRAATDQLEPVLVGATRGVEARLLPERGVPHRLLPAQPIYRRQWWKNAIWPLAGWRLARALGALFDELDPVGAIGTGGYASAPVVWWAHRRGVPTAIQEQNAFPGLANRFLARRVDHIYLGLREAGARLAPGAHTTVFETGNPITPPDPSRRDAARARWGLTPGQRALLVTGGSQGALAVNRAVAAWLDAGFPPELALIWVTGRGTHADFARFHQPPHVHVIPFLDPMADAYAVVDLVVGRAGMLTVAELCAWGLPSVLVPLPTAAADHQRLNAVAMEQAGAAELLPQAALADGALPVRVRRLLTDEPMRAGMAARALARGKPDAAREIVSKFLTLCAFRPSSQARVDP